MIVRFRHTPKLLDFGPGAFFLREVTSRTAKSQRPEQIRGLGVILSE